MCPASEPAADASLSQLPMAISNSNRTRDCRTVPNPFAFIGQCTRGVSTKAEELVLGRVLRHPPWRPAKRLAQGLT